MVLAGAALRAVIVRHQPGRVQVEERGGEALESEPAGNEFFPVLGVGETECAFLGWFTETLKAGTRGRHKMEFAQLKHRAVHPDLLSGFLPSKL
ncbi:hypothetical protein StoSoilB22_15850 [Arthrobacter sp. StoSoilB22]|nr:hypothetical protein StoSoilB22_15850 [Arthrobacter sp. StoSoilB22]